MDECFLVDNGSLRAEATRSLRGIAAQLTERVEFRVEPVSLLHSDKVPAEALGGQTAETLETALRRRAADGLQSIGVLPLFFGPSRALTDFIPARINKLKKDWPALEVTLAPPLSDGSEPADDMLAQMLRDGVLSTIQEKNLDRPGVVLVDHGSPIEPVTAVRDRLGERLEKLLCDSACGYSVASMERREGEAYAFNEPLLETVLRQSPFCDGDTVISLLFLNPGRHAGADGDIAEICQAAETEQTNLRTHMTDLLGTHPLLIDLLAERFAQLAALRWPLSSESRPR